MTLNEPHVYCQGILDRVVDGRIVSSCIALAEPGSTLCAVHRAHPGWRPEPDATPETEEAVREADL
jgi:hypothetical protein